MDGFQGKLASPDWKARLIKRGIESHGGYDYQPVEMGLDMDRMG